MAETVMIYLKKFPITASIQITHILKKVQQMEIIYRLQPVMFSPTFSKQSVANNKQILHDMLRKI